MRLLLVEDDELLGDAVKIGLTQFGYVVDWLKDGDMAETVVKTESFDLIILDLGLPKRSGMMFLQSLRQSSNKTPVIILTARESVEDRIKARTRAESSFKSKGLVM